MGPLSFRTPEQEEHIAMGGSGASSTVAGPGRGRGPGGGRKTVLIVDDETDILDSITALLKAVDANPDVVTARDGKEALEVLDRQDVDLIVTDYRMPRMDGLELLTAARERHPDMPMIMITAYPDPGLEDTAKHTLKVVRFIRKPFEPTEIISAVEEVLR